MQDIQSSASAKKALISSPLLFMVTNVSMSRGLIVHAECIFTAVSLIGHFHPMSELSCPFPSTIVRRGGELVCR